MKSTTSRLLIFFLLACFSVVLHSLFLDETEVSADADKLEIEGGGVADAGSILPSESTSNQIQIESAPNEFNEGIQQAPLAGIDAEYVELQQASEATKQQMLISRYGDFIDSLSLSVNDEDTLSRIMISVLDALNLQLSAGVITEEEYPKWLESDMEATLRAYLTDEEMNAYYDFEAERAEVAASAFASQAEAQNAMEARQNLEFELQARMSLVNRGTRGETPIDSDDVLEGLKGMVALAFTMPETYAADTSNVEGLITKAEGSIWGRKSEFDAMAMELMRAAQFALTLAETDEQAEFREAVTAVGAACGSCHDAFRVGRTCCEIGSP